MEAASSPIFDRQLTQGSFATNPEKTPKLEKEIPFKSISKFFPQASLTDRVKSKIPGEVKLSTDEQFLQEKVGEMAAKLSRAVEIIQSPHTDAAQKTRAATEWTTIIKHNLHELEQQLSKTRASAAFRNHIENITTTSRHLDHLLTALHPYLSVGDLAEIVKQAGKEFKELKASKSDNKESELKFLRASMQNIVERKGAEELFSAAKQLIYQIDTVLIDMRAHKDDLAPTFKLIEKALGSKFWEESTLEHKEKLIQILQNPLVAKRFQEILSSNDKPLKQELILQMTNLLRGISSEAGIRKIMEQTGIPFNRSEVNLTDRKTEIQEEILKMLISTPEDKEPVKVIYDKVAYNIEHRFLEDLTSFGRMTVMGQVLYDRRAGAVSKEGSAGYFREMASMLGVTYGYLNSIGRLINQQLTNGVWENFVMTTEQISREPVSTSVDVARTQNNKNVLSITWTGVFPIMNDAGRGDQVIGYQAAQRQIFINLDELHPNALNKEGGPDKLHLEVVDHISKLHPTEQQALKEITL